MNPLDKLGDKPYQKLTNSELVDIEDYILNTYGQKVGMRIIRLSHNIGWGSKRITSLAAINRAIEYYRRQRIEDDVEDLGD